MSGPEKPFACNTAGCSMSFVNEDHLTVHKKKHDMMLNLGINNKNNFFIADQTPTPTRFIRNCDEVGLFQDLHNDNPFEETFRRAVEAGKSGVLTVPEGNENDDTLHTPNIFPHITEECSSTVIESSHKQLKSETPTTLVVVSKKEVTPEDSTKCNEECNKINIDSGSKENTTVQSTLNLQANHSSIQKSGTNLSINGAEMQLLLKTEDGKVLRFVAAPVVEDDQNTIRIQPKQNPPKAIIAANNNCNKSSTKTVQNQRLSMAKMKLKQTLTKNGTVIDKKPVQNYENENKPVTPSEEKSVNRVDPVKKQAILERNRASSMRARAKRKAWVEQLQYSLKLANETNANLQAQLKSLQIQIEKLKALLLAHKDCPVTKAMEEGNGIIVSSKVVAIKPNSVTQMPVIAKPIKAVKRPRTGKPIAPTNKKSIILPTVMSPIILPTSDSTPNTITLHAAEAVKPIPTINIVTPLVTNANNGGTILGFLHPNSTKVPITQQQQQPQQQQPQQQPQQQNFLVDPGFSENDASEVISI